MVSVSCFEVGFCESNVTTNRSSTTTTSASYTRLTHLTRKTTKTARVPTKHATADKRTIARSTVTAFNLQSFTKPPSHGTTTAPLKHTLDSQKPTSKQDTETTSHHSATPSTKTPPNLANTSGHSRTTTLNILFPGASYHLALPTTAPVKDATSA